MKIFLLKLVSLAGKIKAYLIKSRFGEMNARFQTMKHNFCREQALLQE